MQTRVAALSLTTAIALSPIAPTTASSAASTPATTPPGNSDVTAAQPVVGVRSATPPQVGHPAVGLASVGSDATAQDIVDQLRQAEHVAGVVVSVNRDGVEDTAMAGHVVNQRTAAGGANTTARIGSVTKMMIATLVFQQAERGTWSLDQPISHIMPDINLDRTDITLRQLLNHSSGVPNWDGSVGPGLCPDGQTLKDPDGGTFRYPNGTAVDDVRPAQRRVRKLNDRWNAGVQLDWVSQWNWVHEPGESFCFSDSGYTVLGELLHHATGKPVGQLLNDNIFTPANMPLARYQHSFATGNPSQSYLPDAMTQIEPDGSHMRYDLSPSDMSWKGAAGAVSATMPELNRFHRALTDGTLLTAESLRQMRTGTTAMPTIGAGAGLLSPDMNPALPTAGWGTAANTWGTVTWSLISEDGKTAVSMAISHPMPALPAPSGEPISQG